MKNRLLIFFLLFGLFAFAQYSKSDIYKNISVFSHPSSDSLSIETIINFYQEGRFVKEREPHIFKNLSDNTLWFHISLNKPDSIFEATQYLTLTFPYLQYGKAYVRNDNSLKALQEVTYGNMPYKHVFYRYPVWKIPKDFTNNSDLFLEVKNNSGRTKLELLLESENHFLKRIEMDYFGLGSYFAFLISMMVILLFFAILEKRYIVILYALYISSMLIEFLAGKGLGVEYLWADSAFLTYNIRSLIQTIAALLLGLFYTNFYKFSNQQHINKLVFKWSSLITVPLLLIYLYKYLFGGLVSYYLVVWALLKVIVLIYLANHIYLAYKKQLPIYLVAAFLLPIVSVLVIQEINPLASNSDFTLFLIENIYYLAIAIEIIVFTWYIFSTVINTQLKYFKLKKLSEDLKNNFQKDLLQNQENERQRLLSDVHDSFGGYIEALKLRLLQNKTVDSSSGTEELLDSFYAEYRYLLNNLYSPKINSVNFTAHLIDYCNKIQEITNINFICDFSVNDIFLTQSSCIHLYRIVSESLTNAVKHSFASQIEISLVKNSQNTIQLLIKDNGVGFDLNKKANNQFGLKNIYERVAAIKGTIKINSVKNLGTTINIIIPNVTK